MKYPKILVGLTTIAMAINSYTMPLHAESPGATRLETRFAELERHVRVLKRQLEVKKEDEDKKKTDTPIVTANGKDGFSLKAPDDSFRFKFRGYIQADGRFFLDNGPVDTFTLRRVRPIFEGTVNKNFDYYLLPSFDGGTAGLQDAFLEYKENPKAKLKIGKFKVPFGLERLQSVTNTSFVEFGFPTALAPNRDVGAQISGDVLNGTLNYAAGIFNGTPNGGNSDTDSNSDKELAIRLFAQPFKNGDSEALRGLSLGIATTFGHQEGAGYLSAIRSPGQATIYSYSANVVSNGTHTRLSPQFNYYYGPFGLLGEYVSSKQEIALNRVGGKSKNDAWQIATTYVLTGEDASFKGVTPLKPFDLEKRQWGGIELAVRYHELDIDDSSFSNKWASSTASITEAKAYGLGFNWYLNKNLKSQLDYERTSFKGGATAGKDRDSEDAVFTRFQVSF